MSSTTKSVPLGNVESTRFTIRQVKCAENALATRLDLQSVLQSGFTIPYLSGIKLYCSDNSPSQTLNFFDKPAQSNTTYYETVIGEHFAVGITAITAAHSKTYVHGLAYGNNTGVGNLQGTVWQQAARPEFAGCKLVGIDAGFVMWFDVARLHFVCRADGQSPSLATATAPAHTLLENPQASSSSSSSFSAMSMGVGIAIGIGIGIAGVVAVVVQGVVFHRRSRSAPNPAALIHSPVASLSSFNVIPSVPSTPRMQPQPTPAAPYLTASVPARSQLQTLAQMQGERMGIGDSRAPPRADQPGMLPFQQ